MLNLSPAVCHKGACWALVQLERSVVRLSTQASELEKDWQVPVAQPQQAPLPGCVPEPAADLLCPNTDVPWPLPLGDLNSYKELQLWPFCQTRSVLAQADSYPDTAFSCRAIAPYTFCTDPRTPREMFCSFVFTSLTFAVTTQQLTELPIHAVLAGKRLAGVPQQESITAQWKGAFPSPLWARFGEGVSNRDVAEQKPARLKATPFPLQHNSLPLQPSKFLLDSVPCLIRVVKW